jgi:hypothetical protein
VHSPEGGLLEGLSLRVLPNLRRKWEYWEPTSPYANNSLFISWLLSRLVEKKYFHVNVENYLFISWLLSLLVEKNISMGMWEIGEAPSA